MRKATKVGLLMVAASIILSVWVIAGQSSKADQDLGGFHVDDSGQLLSVDAIGSTVNVPEGVTSIPTGIFNNNSGITQVTLPSTLTGVGSGAFMECSNLTSVSFASGAGALSIGSNAFNGCTSLSSVVLPDNLTSIGGSAFYGCASLGSITIPSGVTSIDTSAFQECKNLTTFAVASGNSTYQEAGGCIYNSGRTRLLMVPEGKTAVSIAPGTQTIASGAFSGCSSLDTLTVPSSVTTIEADAFSNSGITSITIPATVRSIGTQSGWTTLNAIYGAPDSAAMEFAMANGIPFYTIGESGSSGDDPNASGTDNPTQGDPSDTGNSGSPTDGNGNPTDGMTDQGNGTFADAQGNLFYADGTPVASGTSTNGQGSGNGTHTLDDTPTTADGIDPRYFLCLAIFASGIGVILYSRFNKMQYVSHNKKH